MGVSVSDQEVALSEIVVLLEVKKLQESYPVTVRLIAEKWLDGMKALLGLTVAIGLVSAPLSSGRLESTTQSIVGLGLTLVVALATIGLLLLMSAAYGTANRHAPPCDLVELTELRTRVGNELRRSLQWGRSLSLAALLVLSATVATAWLGIIADDVPGDITGSE